VLSIAGLASLAAPGASVGWEARSRHLMLKLSLFRPRERRSEDLPGVAAHLRADRVLSPVRANTPATAQPSRRVLTP
jgi:hypothetical protein